MSDSWRYAIGQQDFKVLREGNAVYVDKTPFIERIVRSNSKYYFLARPRRFGKSLFLSALRYFFEGQRQLFKGLHADSMDWDWAEYPVLRLDLNMERYAEEGLLDTVLDNIFLKWERKYDVEQPAGADLSTRFQNIIEGAHEKTGRQVVILVDEYDKPLVANLNDDILFEHYRRKLASLYSNFKSSAEHIRLVFLTGVSRFSKLSIFSDLNNINDITFDDEYADICGITERELIDNFRSGIEGLAEVYEMSGGGILEMLRKNYDGYRFAKRGSDIYNPWSVLNAMMKKDISNYWSRTGSPTILAETLKNINADLEAVTNARCPFRQLEGMDLKSVDPTALLYQTGYLTIKEYNRKTDMVRLGVPNTEVKQSLFDELLPFYLKTKRRTPEGVVFDIIDSLREGQPEQFVRNLDIFLAGIPYEMKMDDENNFHNAVYILLTLIGTETDTEVHTSDGRIDLVVKTDDYIYVIELKFDRSAQLAMRQIEDKQYALPFASDPRRIFKIGLNFSTETRKLDAVCIEN